MKAGTESLREFGAYFSQYLQAKTDGAKATARLLVLYAFLSVFGILVALTTTVTATVLLVIGVAGGIERLLGGEHRAWLANLLVGVVFIAGVGVGMSVAYPLVMGRLRRRTVRKYEAIQRKQREQFGHSATDKAKEPINVR